MTAPTPVPVAAAFGKRARALREARDWTLDAMAARTGLGRATLYRIEQGGNPRLGTAEKVARAFGVPLAVMLVPEAS